jgi:hypothetical protein
VSFKKKAEVGESANANKTKQRVKGMAGEGAEKKESAGRKGNYDWFLIVSF